MGIHQDDKPLLHGPEVQVPRDWILPRVASATPGKHSSEPHPVPVMSGAAPTPHEGALSGHHQHLDRILSWVQSPMPY